MNAVVNFAFLTHLAQLVAHNFIDVQLNLIIEVTLMLNPQQVNNLHIETRSDYQVLF